MKLVVGKVINHLWLCECPKLRLLRLGCIHFKPFQVVNNKCCLLCHKIMYSRNLYCRQPLGAVLSGFIVIASMIKVVSGFIQASSCKIQGLLKTFLLFSRTENV